MESIGTHKEIYLTLLANEEEKNRQLLEMETINRYINHPELGLVGNVFGLAPVQAEGTIDGNAFYFRARYSSWSFAISEHSEVSPVSLEKIEDGTKYGFYKEASYGEKDTYAASYMDTEEAEKIIIECCKEYKGDRNR